MKMSKAFYLGSILGAPVVGGAIIAMGFMGAMGGAASGSEAAAQAGVGAMMGSIGLAWIAFLYGAVIQFVMIYKAWSAINDGQARTTPGKAAGFLLIPFFNIYWIFQVTYGFAQDYNKFIARHQKRVPALDEKIFLAYPIAILACIIPLVNLLAAPASLVLAIIVAIKMIDGVNALADAPRAAAATA